MADLNLKIVDASKDQYVAFKGARGKKLGELNAKQLEDLAYVARKSNNPNLLEHFDGELPALEDLQTRRTDREKAALPKQQGPAAKDQKPASENTPPAATPKPIV